MRRTPHDPSSAGPSSRELRRRFAGDPKLRDIRRLGLGRDLDEQIDLARLADEVVLPAGRRLMAQGEWGREVFLVLAGEAVVERDGVEVAVVGAGGVLGEVAVHDPSKRRNATVTARTEVRALVIDVRTYRSLRDRPGLTGLLVPAA